MIAILIHLPVIFVRVTRWDVVQNWCLVSTFLVLMVYVLAFVSTKFAADQILVWTPLVLIIDAGSMLQIFFLVIETTALRVGESIFLFDLPQQPNLLGRLWQHIQRLLSRGDGDIELAAPINPPEAPNAEENAEDDPENGAGENHGLIIRPVGDKSNPAVYTAALSMLLFLAAVILQLMGLQAAFKARRAEHTPLVSWCSPSFQPFGIAVIDGDCHIYDISQSSTRGIGCVKIRGVWQRQWLTATIIGTILSLIFEIVDLIVLYKVRVDKKWRGIKMKRPWATLIGGLVILSLTLFYGLEYASRLPPGITERVTIAVNVDGPKAFSANLTTSGLRGTIIGWNDGLFDSWKEKYTGSSSQ